MAFSKLDGVFAVRRRSALQPGEYVGARERGASDHHRVDAGRGHRRRAGLVDDGAVAHDLYAGAGDDFPQHIEMQPAAVHLRGVARMDRDRGGAGALRRVEHLEDARIARMRAKARLERNRQVGVLGHRA